MRNERKESFSKLMIQDDAMSWEAEENVVDVDPGRGRVTAVPWDRCGSRSRTVID